MTTLRDYVKCVTLLLSLFQYDVFTISAVDLGQLEQVVVGHDGEGLSSSWLLDKIVVKRSDNAEKESVFMCNA